MPACACRMPTGQKKEREVTGMIEKLRMTEYYRILIQSM